MVLDTWASVMSDLRILVVQSPAAQLHYLVTVQCLEQVLSTPAIKSGEERTDMSSSLRVPVKNSRPLVKLRTVKVPLVSRGFR
jgi:hypothetical protein